MFDLGYLDYGRLGRIEDNDGWFVCRLNADANPHVIDELRTVRGNSIDLEGMHLQEALPDLYRQTIDIIAMVGADRHDPHLPYDLRVVGVRHEDDEDAPAYRDDVDADHEYHPMRRIFPGRCSRRENLRRCTAIGGASKPSFKNSKRSSD